jgi:formylglycine-generating enzyme
MIMFKVLAKCILFVVILVSVFRFTQASVFNLGGTLNPATDTWTGLASLEFVTVGDPGNRSDTRFTTPGEGAVSYTYQIGKYEVTAGQYTVFLNAVASNDPYGLYNIYMNTANGTWGCNIQRGGSAGNYTYSVAPDWANRPVNFVSWGDSARFVNWLSNGQPSGQLTGVFDNDAKFTEDGSYYLNGVLTASQLMGVNRKSNATFVIPNGNEWYKAAYYKSGSVNAGYWNYPMRSNTQPSNKLINPDPGDNGNFRLNPAAENYVDTIGPPYYCTEVGVFEKSFSAYGTYDQGGNVWEWSEARPGSGTWSRAIRGGSYVSDSYSSVASNPNMQDYPDREGSIYGFRVGCICNVPEPSTLLLLGISTLVLLVYTWRR